MAVRIREDGSTYIRPIGLGEGNFDGNLVSREGHDVRIRARLTSGNTFAFDDHHSTMRHEPEQRAGQPSCRQARRPHLDRTSRRWRSTRCQHCLGPGPEAWAIVSSAPPLKSQKRASRTSGTDSSCCGLTHRHGWRGRRSSSEKFVHQVAAAATGGLC